MLLVWKVFTTSHPGSWHGEKRLNKTHKAVEDESIGVLKRKYTPQSGSWLEQVPSWGLSTLRGFLLVTPYTNEGLVCGQSEAEVKLLPMQMKTVTNQRLK